MPLSMQQVLTYSALTALVIVRKELAGYAAGLAGRLTRRGIDKDLHRNGAVP